MSDTPNIPDDVVKRFAKTAEGRGCTPGPLGPYLESIRAALAEYERAKAEPPPPKAKTPARQIAERLYMSGTDPVWEFDSRGDCSYVNLYNINEVHDSLEKAIATLIDREREAAAKEEREACAKLAYGDESIHSTANGLRAAIARQIRARVPTPSPIGPRAE